VECIDKDELIKLLQELILIPSSPGEEQEICEYISSYAKNSDFTSIHVSDHWDVVLRLDGRGKGSRVLFLTHTDHSKPAHPEGISRPDVIDGDRFGKRLKVVTGTGSRSPKGTLAAMLYAGKVLAQKRMALKGSLIIAAVSRDLLANHDGIREVAEKGWVDADMAVVGEPSNNEPAIGARGINVIAVTIRGSPTHAGKPEAGSNPIWTLEHVLEGLKTLATDLPSHPSLGKATLTPIDIRCETRSPQTPSSCCLILDRRTLPGEDPIEVAHNIERNLVKFVTGTNKVDVQVLKQMYPFEGDPDSLISKYVKNANETVTGSRTSYSYISFSTNGGFLTNKMRIPSVIYGPGRIDHTFPIEHVEVNSVLIAARVYVATACRILGPDSQEGERC
jgi:acetylornithine deacetylase/succinyl-diaminopimelate desuccinylase-like protein